MVKVAVTLRVIENQNYSEKRDAISHDWIGFLEKRNICPVLIPNAISSPLSFLSALGNIDGVLLTSGNDYGIEGSPDSAAERDSLEESLIRFAEEKYIPVVGVCRGLHVLNCYYGGSIVPFLADKGKGTHVNKMHAVTLLRDYIELPHEWEARFEVNSYHNHGVSLETLAPDMYPFAVDDNGIVEGIKHKRLPFWGVQWHPERNNPARGVDTWLFDIFKQA
ncbi:MAG: gamma-glutamyl-gamma-aminobutyrate hydrolase family protein [Thermodesulfobacteriota bacterium]|nr:gamma-glutamyl-gamma-aminobutyrate hydrolase family protein [Thermodesulfobacteriota bacterium]